MNCTQIHTHLWMLAEGSLDSQRREELLSHLSACEECSAKYQLIKQVESIILAQKTIEPSPWILSRIQQKIAAQKKSNDTAIPQRQPVSIRMVYIVAIGFAVISAFATGYFIGKNNFQYMNSANQVNQKQTEQSQANSTTDQQYENSFSIY